MEEKPVPRKMKFAPKAPPKRPPKPEVKCEPVENDNTAEAMDLLRRINEGSLRTKGKVEKKVSASQIAWIGGVANSTRSYGFQKGGSSSSGAGAASGTLEENDYKEPWDYYSNYPVTLPTRRPHSGNPELLDEEEFGQASQTSTYEEISINSAAELGLREDNVEPRMFLMQLPAMPMVKRTPTTDGVEAKDSSRMSRADEETCGLNELPGGFMGKMLVYRSGAVKLKLGDMLYDVNPGLKCEFSQDVMAINTTEKAGCLIGELNKHAVLTPDLDSILNSIDDI